MRPFLRLANAAHDASIDPRQPSDAELLARLADDDADALEVALARYWGLVVDYVARLAPSLDAAEDIAQRTFCQLWTRRAQWAPAGSLRALLCRIARNYAVSEHRRALADERSAMRFFDLRSPDADIAETIDAERLQSIVAREVAKLPARRCEIVVLRCYHDLSYKEIAEVMDIAEQTVANQLSRALTSLRLSLGAALD